jgi:hypothetical protein
VVVSEVTHTTRNLFARLLYLRRFGVAAVGASFIAFVACAPADDFIVYYLTNRCEKPIFVQHVNSAGKSFSPPIELPNGVTQSFSVTDQAVGESSFRLTVAKQPAITELRPLVDSVIIAGSQCP